ncbi:MAG TPA: sigma-70 family RNA polymerase sigma factor [Polyangiales bacterium]|nr:sigma-70 family RNA polymerase sigma factor [Polyangiales bacterium]
MRRVQAGDAEASARLVGMFLRAAYLSALSIVTRPSDAEDVAQDAFVSALEHIHSCREPARFAGWFLQIVRNRALNWLERRKHRDVPANDERAPAAISGEPSPGSPRLKQQLLTALNDLTETQREIVLLHDLEEWTHGEIADALGLSEVMCRQHLWNARRKLRAHLSDHAPVEKK